jgi:hypothetical protein
MLNELQLQELYEAGAESGLVDPPIVIDCSEGTVA